MFVRVQYLGDIYVSGGCWSTFCTGLILLLAKCNWVGIYQGDQNKGVLSNETLDQFVYGNAKKLLKITAVP